MLPSLLPSLLLSLLLLCCCVVVVVVVVVLCVVCHRELLLVACLPLSLACCWSLAFLLLGVVSHLFNDDAIFRRRLSFRCMPLPPTLLGRDVTCFTRWTRCHQLHTLDAMRPCCTWCHLLHTPDAMPTIAPCHMRGLPRRPPVRVVLPLRSRAIGASPSRASARR